MDEGVLPHSEHWKGFSPVCVRMWFRTLICFLKACPQMPHTKLRSVAWALRRWCVSCSWDGKVFGHKRQEKAPLSDNGVEGASAEAAGLGGTPGSLQSFEAESDPGALFAHSNLCLKKSSVLE
uniref:Uncharacterized protein n=1 Tax=Oryzias latipes TaxID=8090 RepID=A0A3P9K0U8_ORYLA